MELPIELRAAIETEAACVPQSQLRLMADSLSRRYREDARDGHSMLSRSADAIAYAAARMPATYCAVRTALKWALPDGCGYRTLLDAGAGTGAASWAAAGAIDSLSRIDCLEREQAMLSLGSRLMQGSQTFADIDVNWRREDMNSFRPAEQYDLVISSYMMNEMSGQSRDALIERLWAATGGMLLILEPGTPAGFSLLRAVRERVIALGGHVTAPCPHENACPLDAGDWCHFTCRVARSRLHKLLKGGDAPYEDEKFSYMAFTREPASRCSARVLRHPKIEPGRITLSLCMAGGLETRAVLKRDKAAFKIARKAECGDALLSPSNDI